VSVHLLPIDVQELANAVQEIRTACDLIEHIIQQSLIEANKNDGTDASNNSNT
jgi:hypothetical protein